MSEDVGTIYEKLVKTLVICQTEPNTPLFLRYIRLFLI